MSMRDIVKNSTDQSVVIRIIDSTDGTPETGVDYDTSGIDLWYRREAATKTSITEAALAALDSAHSDGGIEHIGDGYYRLDLPDAAVATGCNGVMVGGAVTGMIVIGCYIALIDMNPYDSVRAGLTALPNAAADAAGGLVISDAGGLDADTMASNVTAILADTGTDGVVLANDAITSAKYDETTAFPIASADSGATQIARVGADGDTLETLSDQIDAVPTAAEIQAEMEENGASILDTISDKLPTNYIMGSSDQTDKDDDIDAILVDTGTTLENHLTDIKGTGFVKDTDSLPQCLTATGFSTHSAADVRTEMDANSTQLAAIVGDTDELQQELADGGRTDLILDELTAQGDTNEGKLDTIDGIVDAIVIDTTEIGAAGAGLTAVPYNAAWDAEIQSEVQDAIEANHLDHIFAVTYDPASKPGVADALLNELVENDGGVSRYTANALEQAPSGGTNPNVLDDTTIASINSQTSFTLTAGSDQDDAYVDQAVVLYDASNSDYPSIRVVATYTGATKTVTIDSAPDFTIQAGDGVKIFVTAPGTTAPTVGQIRAEMDSNSTQLAAIVGDTDEIQQELADGGRLDLLIDAILGDTNELQTDLVNGGRLDLLIDAILADTNELQGDWTDGGRLDLLIDSIITNIAALNNLSAADVNAQVLDVLNTDTFAEPGQGAPAATASLAAKIGYLYKFMRNKSTTTSSVINIYNDAGDTIDQKATQSDDGTTYTRGEFGTGA